MNVCMCQRGVACVRCAFPKCCVFPQQGAKLYLQAPRWLITLWALAYLWLWWVTRSCTALAGMVFRSSRTRATTCKIPTLSAWNLSVGSFRRRRAFGIDLCSQPRGTKGLWSWANRSPFNPCVCYLGPFNLIASLTKAHWLVVMSVIHLLSDTIATC